MADVQLRSVIRHLRRVIVTQGWTWSLTDAQLIEAFLHHRDGTAMEMLVWRHGTMVLNLCRRILRDEHHAEDAFQATFLVFVRNAGSIGKHQSVGSWLHKVAYRVSHRLRARLAKHPEQRTDVDLDHFPKCESADDVMWRDTRSVLDEEINRLPEKYRSPIILCYLQGHTCEEVADLLGRPRDTIKSQLLRGREQLKSRLIRRGLSMSAGWLATNLSVNVSSAAIPAMLVHITVEAALAFAAGQAASGLVSSNVAALTQGVLRTMFLTKLKTATIIAFAFATLAAGIASIGQLVLANSHRNREASRKMAVVPAADVRSTQKNERSNKVSEPSLQQKKLEDTLPPDIVAAWEKAGAEAGWTAPRPYQSWGVPWTKKRKAGEVPAFRFKVVPPVDVLAKLPQPGRAYGFFLNDRLFEDNKRKLTDHHLKELARLNSLQVLEIPWSEVTDVGLKEVARQKMLQALDISKTHVTDAALRELAGLLSLTHLGLIDTQVTDAGLKELTGLKSLTSLYVGKTSVTDAGIKALGGLMLLQELDLTDTHVTDAGVKELVGLTSLKWLQLRGTQVTGSSLSGLKSLETLLAPNTPITEVELKELKSLQVLRLDSTQLTDEGMKGLAGLESLRHLILRNTPITDIGLKALAGLKSLETLSLQKTQVTDAGLKELAGLKSLKEIYLSQTQVTAAGIAELRKSLPKLRVETVPSLVPGKRNSINSIRENQQGAADTLMSPLPGVVCATGGVTSPFPR